VDRRDLKKRNKLVISIPNTVCINCTFYTPNEAKEATCLDTPLQPYMHHITGDVLYPEGRPFALCDNVNTNGNCPKYQAKE